MLPLKASKLLIVEGVLKDSDMRQRAQRLSRGIEAKETKEVSDEELNAVIRDQVDWQHRHGMRDSVDHVVIFNRFRFDDTEEEQKRRNQAFPAINRLKFNGYGGFDWRDSGSSQWRRQTSLVCQPAWQLHTITGCPFRCAYCHLGRFINLMLNMEEFVARLDRWLEKCQTQTLFQYDNYTDTVCFEPEYGGAKLLIDYFAGKPGKALELYVGKSDNVDFMLDYDHRGHTVCCWSLSPRTQSREFEWRTASMEQRIESIRKCQDAGYPVRVRLSPIIPIRNWREENREMIELLFRDVRPDVITFETIRFLTWRDIGESFDVSLLDDAFIAAMKAAEGQPFAQGCQVPDDFRREVCAFIISELERVSPETRYAFCREHRSMWDCFAQDFARHDQSPDSDYLCNCGPKCAPTTVVPMTSN